MAPTPERPNRRPGPRPPWRLLLDGPDEGLWNMALDEALLDGYVAAGGDRAPTVRLYGWTPPTLSLGRAQPYRGTFDDDALRRSAIGVVRRPTGGMAVLHDCERTYAVIGRLGGEPFPGGVLETYARISRALTRALARLGLAAEVVRHGGKAVGRRSPDCFSWRSPYEITVGGRKIIGSAQLRRRGAFLQHGSVVLEADALRLRRLLGDDDVGRGGALGDALGRIPESAEVDAAIIRGFEETFGVRLVAGEAEPAEIERAERLRCWKYASLAWTVDGRVGERERRWGPRL